MFIFLHYIDLRILYFTSVLQTRFPRSENFLKTNFEESINLSIIFANFEKHSTLATTVTQERVTALII